MNRWLEFVKQMREQNPSISLKECSVLYKEQKSSGIVSKVKNFFTKNYRSDFNKQGREILEQYKNNKINYVIIKRKPVTKVIQQVVNLLSMGTVNKIRNKLNYDDLYHLYLELKLDNGTRVKLEKNQTPVLSIITKEDSAESFTIPILKKVSLEQFITNGKKLLGEKFYTYNIVSNNCQFFVSELLKANKIYESKWKNFIWQDAKTLLSQTFPLVKQSLDKLLNLVTKSDMLLSDGLKH
jgi:hypothetical protein